MESSVIPSMHSPVTAALGRMPCPAPGRPCLATGWGQEFPPQVSPHPPGLWPACRWALAFRSTLVRHRGPGSRGPGRLCSCASCLISQGISVLICEVGSDCPSGIAVWVHACRETSCPCESSEPRAGCLSHQSVRSGGSTVSFTELPSTIPGTW